MHCVESDAFLLPFFNKPETARYAIAVYKFDKVAVFTKLLRNGHGFEELWDAMTADEQMSARDMHGNLASSLGRVVKWAARRRFRVPPSHWVMMEEYASPACMKKYSQALYWSSLFYKYGHECNPETLCIADEPVRRAVKTLYTLRCVPGCIVGALPRELCQIIMSHLQ
jgi:hypothetical protein